MHKNSTHKRFFVIKYFLFCIVLLLALSCREQKKGPSKEDQARYQENLVRVNRYLVGADADKIRGYMKRRHWAMNTSKTGLWYMIYKNGSGADAQTGKQATLNYKVWLLDGTLCYSSEKSGPKKFRIGQGGVESGLEEGVLLLKVGDKARFIMPPHLAQGLIGDQDKIPPRSCIVYEVELVQISD
jgi:FKBP-type peptidyl-prolyl cis-trans isomerase